MKTKLKMGVYTKKCIDISKELTVSSGSKSL